MFWASYQGTKKRAQQLQHKLMFYRQNIAIIRAGDQAFGIKSLKSEGGKLQQQFGQIDKKVGLEYSQLFQSQQGLTIKCGILSNSQQGRFSRTIFRITRGNCYIKFIAMKDVLQKVREKQQHKLIYFLLFPAKSDSYLQRKINKFISNYNLPLEQYRYPNNPKDYLNVLKEIMNQYNQAEHLLTLVKKDQLLFYNKLLGLSDNQETDQVMGNPIPNQFYKI